MNGFKANTDKLAWRVVDGEAVVVHAETSAYYGLNGTATVVWQLLADDARQPEDLAARLCERFGISADTAKADVEKLLAGLEKEGLLLRSESAIALPAPNGAGAPARAADYVAPEFSRYGELEQLVLSGE